ncbi:MAG: GNAT family N-acetyltransferase [Lachnospiraceae bacterium]|nr:GNAT family N-acetyltransferase [Lachnospiraceae bacterium]
MIRMANRLTRWEQKRLQKKTEEAKRRGGVSASLFLENEMNALSDADCFFFSKSRLRPEGLLTVFFPDEEHAEITVAEFVPGKNAVSPLFLRALKECHRVGVNQIHTVRNPVYEFDFGKVDGVNFTYDWSEYMLCNEMCVLAAKEVRDAEQNFSIKKEASPEGDGTVRYALSVAGQEAAECRILPMDGGKQCYLFGLKTKEAFRRKGMATALLKAIAGDYVQYEGAIMRLQVSSRNEPAEHLYRKLGFRTEEQRDYFKTEVSDGK